MTGVEIILLLIGAVFMIGSFFVAEKLSPSELNQIARLSENELNNIIGKGLVRQRQRSRMLSKLRLMNRWTRQIVHLRKLPMRRSWQSVNIPIL